ncbi:hypothetical protein FNY88_12565 [Corynebacterium guaraldiae]|uniref:Heparinase II/III-like C-terminal domain-containing protein n=1 Tax=Corynebacterium guaraldiae TaxID=3051103 RepID=A0ABY3CQV7_9CORY|nr:heparinase II/III family protein [Corynebacterium guaraldiae]TRX45287.1 hypothetical protein FNY88_12565 [Corynebacterium guaraldiae]
MTSIGERSRQYYSPYANTSARLNGRELLIGLPTKEAFKIGLDSPIDWGHIESGLSVSGKLYLHGGQFLYFAESSLDEEGFCKLVESYSLWVGSREVRECNRRNYSWDHATAMRIETMVMLSFGGSINLEAHLPVRDLVKDDIAWASEVENIPLNNHGVFVVGALLFAKLHLREEGGLWLLNEIGRVTSLNHAVSERFPSILDSVYGDDGWCGENSPMYDRVWINLLSGLKRSFPVELQELGVLSKIDWILEESDLKSRFLILRNKRYVPRGDTPRQLTRLSPLSGTVFSKRVGIWAHSDKDLYLLATCGYSSVTHKHPDDTQVYLAYKGIDFFIDGGFHSYNYSDPRVLALRTYAAHSVLSLSSVDSVPPWKAYAQSRPVADPKMTEASEQYVKMTNVINRVELTRRIELVNQHRIEVKDSWSGVTDDKVIVRFLLANNCEWSLSGRTLKLSRLGIEIALEFDSSVIVEEFSGERVAPFRGWYSTHSNQLIQGKCLEIQPSFPVGSGSLRYAIVLG